MDENMSIDVIEVVTSKKHKKHKHKKHKRKKEAMEKLKPSFVSTMGSISVSPVRNIAAAQAGVSPKSGKKKKGKGGKESGTSSDEERWLDAIQSGKLEEVDDELKKIKPKDPKLMTARQRAMMERKGDAVPDPSAEQLLSLPSGYREKVMTPEMAKKAAFKALKRKQLLDEKREKDKKRTMERLLRKQENKANKSVKKSAKKSTITIMYKDDHNGISISLPPGVEFQLPEPRQAEFKNLKCGVEGCDNLKKYTCSKTNVPLCSLKCYNINLAAFKMK